MLSPSLVPEGLSEREINYRSIESQSNNSLTFSGCMQQDTQYSYSRQQCSLQVSHDKYFVVISWSADLCSILQHPVGRASNLEGKQRIKVSSFVLALDKDHLGQTKPLSSTNKKRPWTEFRQSLSSFLVGRELLSPLFQIRGCSRLTMNSASPSSLNGPNCKCVRWLERLPDGGKILNLPAGPKNMSAKAEI